ncbi:MAG: tetratricopeptide repeat protein [Cyanobacteria bacterium SZAS LIN-3]|nr:tetratricopeptide repeat protein [Cyanobacteria bacterium SZAS LIN-3]MBS2010956.1 tetratricopeptide repeat protein [Cyanobacteria bacterium SZAS TMP-1]
MLPRKILALTMSVLFSTVMSSTSIALGFAGVGPGFGNSENLDRVLKGFASQSTPQQQQHELEETLKRNGDNNGKSLLIMYTLAEIYEKQEDYAAQERMLLRALKVLNSSPKAHDTAVGLTCLKLVHVYVLLDRLHEAHSYALKGVTFLTRATGKDSADVSTGLNNLAWTEYQLKDYNAARDHFLEAMAIHRRLFGTIDPIYGFMANNLAEVYYQMGDDKSAYVWYKQAYEALADELGENDLLVRDIKRSINSLQMVIKSEPRH